MQEHIVKSYDDELNRLKRYLLEMIESTKVQINKTKDMFFAENFTNWEEITKGDSAIDLLDKKIVDLSLEIFSTRNPVAYDLRFVFSSSHISRNLERIGDNIGKVCFYAKDIQNTHLDINMKIMQIMMILLDMQAILKDSLTSGNLKNLQQVVDLDLQVDNIFYNIAKLTLTEMSKPVTDIVNLNAYSLVARSLERAGDHFVNIVKYIEFMESGELKH